MSDVTEPYVCPADHGHAVNHTCYNSHKCRCTPCRAHANARARRRRQLRAYGRWQAVHVPAVGTQRRLQALVAIGWSQSKLAAHIGTSQANIWNFLFRGAPTVRRDTHERVARLYAELWNTAPEHGGWRSLNAYNRSRNYAAARGWLPPAAWDDIDTDPEPPAVDRDPDYVDDAAVELAIAGHQVPLTAAERCAAVTILNRQHLNDHAIAALLHLDPRSVLRIRARLQLPAAVGADRQPIYDTSRRDAA